MLRKTVAVLVAVLLFPVSVGAECFILTAKFIMVHPGFELVFSGHVVAITRTAELGYRATFEVDRVWKGRVHKRIDVYVWELPAEAPRFREGERTIAVARRLKPDEARWREGVGVTDASAVAFVAPNCSDIFEADIRNHLGPGHAPADR
jgi:hypothetical protein